MQGRVAVVTGAAGGIGRAVAQLLAGDGVAIAMVDQDGGGLAAAAAGLPDGTPHLTMRADVRDPALAEGAVARTEAELGPVDYLVTCAGILRTGPVIGLSDADWADTLTVNCTGVFTMARSVGRRMARRGEGSIVTVASNAARTARAGMAAYAASKAAVRAFTVCLGLELAPYGVRCNVVAPGSTDTPMLTALWKDADSARRKSLTGDPASFRVGIPLGRVAQPADVARAVRFLLSEEAAHITMHDLVIDGGAALGA
ncbi:2,3-dihydro-2,3-dihydroxybenzoate dehydrogenase [Solwaraspora sp. WMMB335]|uniref:2,3-dihydro-2,3-dihydroxybenzoate dehydrogenase n=1 Tax=Solwaraspora sp. WMMB335 TaxID=3404118 RepID=UPI003B956DC9